MNSDERLALTAALLALLWGLLQRLEERTVWLQRRYTDLNVALKDQREGLEAQRSESRVADSNLDGRIGKTEQYVAAGNRTRWILALAIPAAATLIAGILAAAGVFR